MKNAKTKTAFKYLHKVEIETESLSGFNCKRACKTFSGKGSLKLWCTNVYIYIWVNFMVCKLYTSKASLRKLSKNRQKRIFTNWNRQRLVEHV